MVVKKNKHGNDNLRKKIMLHQSKIYNIYQHKPCLVTELSLVAR